MIQGRINLFFRSDLDLSNASEIKGIATNLINIGFQRFCVSYFFNYKILVMIWGKVFKAAVLHAFFKNQNKP